MKAKDELNSIGEILDRLEADKIESEAFEARMRADMVSTYRELIARRNQLTSADSFTLREICDTLGWKRQDIDSDLDALEKIAEQRQFADERPQREAKLAALAKEWSDFEAHCKRKIKELAAEKREAHRQLRVAIAATGEIESIKRRHDRLFGELPSIPSPTITPEPSSRRTATTPAVDLDDAHLDDLFPSAL